MAAVAAEDPAILRNAEDLDMAAENADQLGRDGHPPGFLRRPVLEPSFPCADAVSVQRRLTSGRDFSRVRRPQPESGR
jgi:hypothetical protein